MKYACRAHQLLHVECKLAVSEKMAFCCHFPSDSEASSESALWFPDLLSFVLLAETPQSFSGLIRRGGGSLPTRNDRMRLPVPSAGPFKNWPESTVLSFQGGGPLGSPFCSALPGPGEPGPVRADQVSLKEGCVWTPLACRPQFMNAGSTTIPRSLSQCCDSLSCISWTQKGRPRMISKIQSSLMVDDSESSLYFLL